MSVTIVVVVSNSRYTRSNSAHRLAIFERDPSPERLAGEEVQNLAGPIVVVSAEQIDMDVMTAAVTAKQAIQR